MEPITRAAAKERGLLRYFTGKPCKHGHVSERVTVNGTCYECQKDITRKYAAAHPETIQEKNRAFYRANPEVCRAASRRYGRENPAYVRANTAARRAARVGATPKWADKAAIQGFYEDARWFTEVTGKVHHVDHIVPLRGKNVCGLHVHWNLEVIPATDNLSKGNKWHSA